MSPKIMRCYVRTKAVTGLEIRRGHFYVTFDWWHARHMRGWRSQCWVEYRCTADACITGFTLRFGAAQVWVSYLSPFTGWSGLKV